MKQLIKTLAVIVIAVGVMFIIVNIPQDMTVVNERLDIETLEVETPIEEVEQDVIEKARQELERIKRTLDTKEQELLEQRNSIDAELEKLRTTRTSFQ